MKRIINFGCFIFICLLSSSAFASSTKNEISLNEDVSFEFGCTSYTKLCDCGVTVTYTDCAGLGASQVDLKLAKLCSWDCAPEEGSIDPIEINP